MNRNRLKKISSAALILISIFLFVQPIQANQNALKPGEKAPFFTIPNHEGTMFSLNKLNTKGAIIVFISVQCPVSNAYTTRMIELAKYAKQNNLLFLGINSNATEDLEDVVSHVKHKKLNFEVLKDEANEVADQFGARVTPEVFLIDKSFMVKYHGPIDDNQRQDRVEKNYLKDAIDAYLAGQNINPTDVSPKGCIIKRMR